MDSLDHTKTGRFKYMIQSVSLIRILKEWILPVVTRNNFNTYMYISCLTTLFILTTIFETEAWIKRSILSVLSGKSQYKQDPLPLF